jgi:hypothetical protein
MNKSIQSTNLLKVLIIFLILVSGPSGASAQGEKTIQISPPDHSAYPLISFYMDPTDRDGTPLENIQLEQITLTENGINRDLLELQTLNPGIQLVVAFNLSSPFAIQDNSGQSRFDYIQESLLNWVAQPLETAEDNLSLLDNLGRELIHAEHKSEWIQTLEEMGPVERETVADLTVLSRAIEVASDPVNQPGMKKVVVFFSHQPTSDGFETIDNLISLAKDNQVQVYSVLVSSPAYFESAGASKLQSLSAETGGKFITFSGEEPLADFGQLLLPLRTTYLLEYQSSIVTSGNHTLAVSISSTLGSIEGTREFRLDIQPPNPIFITPPRIVTRTPIEGTLDESEEIQFEPTSLTLPIIVEFPDQHSRDLVEVIFRVDGEIIGTKNTPPYDQFVWNLEDYQISGTHYLTLEAVDSVGLSRLSIETPVEVEVILPPLEFWDIIRNNIPALLGLALVLLLGLVLFSFISRGRIRPGSKRVITWLKALGIRFAGSIKDILQAKKRQPEVDTRNFITYRLIPVNDLSQQLFPAPIQIDQLEITLGNTKLDEGIYIKHPSIMPEHARITLQEEDIFQISDLGSVAGTWINYQQIDPATPHVLKDGDIINIGEAAFRFQIKIDLNIAAANKEK